MVDFQDVIKENYYKCNATNFDLLNNVIKKIQPNEIYNFAGSFSNNYEFDYLNNVIVTKNIFESIISNKILQCKVLINGSAAEYGYIKNYIQPINELHPLYPISLYGLTKVYQTFLAKTYCALKDIQVYITRPFNVIGYGISENLFIGHLINQIKQHLYTKEKIILGNLENERDYIDIFDLLSAYERIMNRGTPGECYNIGSGKSIKIYDLLIIFFEVFDLKMNIVEINKNLPQKYDIPKIVADISKINKLNWEPKISLKDSVEKIKNSLKSEN